MNIIISGRKIEITQPLREHTEDKITRALKYCDKVIDAHVIMYIERYLHTVEITFNLDRKTIFAKEASADMYTSLDLAMKKIIKQLQRYHDHIKSHKAGKEIQEDEIV